MATRSSKGNFYFVIALCLSAVATTSVQINLPQCESCSGRDDIPCKIQKLPYPCFHTEYHDFWPGKPRNLEANKEKIGESKWMANFTWSPPYDASITSLNGFFLTVNIVAHIDTTVLIGPLCFYANLSGTDWTSITEPHAVTFHFDCILAEMKTEVHLFLMSSPKPDHNAEFADSVIYIGDPAQKSDSLIHTIRKTWKNRENQLSSRGRRGGFIRPRPRPEMPTINEVDLKINHTTYVENGDVNVDVWFGPIVPDILYHIICLSPEVSHYAYCEQKVNLTVPDQEYVFTDVPTGYYKIMIRRSSEPTYYVTAKFFVPEPPPAPTAPPGSKSIDTFQILLIIGCALLGVSTTAIFYVLRKYTKWRYCDICQCFLVGRYQQTAQIQPNNNHDQLVQGPAEMKKKVMLIFYPESSIFVEAVEDLAALISRWGDCDVIDQNLYVEEELKEKLDRCCNGYFICIILSEHINMVYEILNHGENLPLDSDLQTQFIFELLKKIHSEGKQKTVLSFFPVKLDNLLLKDEKILTIAEAAGTKLETCKANLMHIFQLFHKIHDNEFSVAAFQESMTAGNEQMTKLLNSVQNLPRGLVTGDKLDNSNIQASARKQSENLLSGDLLEGNNNIAQKNFRDKHLDTLKWTEEQNRLKSGQSEIKWTSSEPYTEKRIGSQIGYKPIKSTECDLDHSCTCDRSCSENDDIFTLDYPRANIEVSSGKVAFSSDKPTKIGIHKLHKNTDNNLRTKESFGSRNGHIRHKASSFRGNKGFYGRRDDNVYPAWKTENLLDEEGEFIPPDSDTESDTQSMLFAKINNRYMENTRQEKVSQL